MLKSGVYRVDLGNEWFYVGSSQDLLIREREHQGRLERGSHGNRIMQNVFNKHRAFVFTVLGRYPVEEIIEREQELLDEYCQDPKCVNIATVAGTSPMTGRNHSDETKAKISASKTGRKLAVEHVAKISAGNKGKARTPEWRAALSAAGMGHEVSEQTRAKLSAANLGKKNAPLTHEHRAAISAAQIGKTKSPEHRAKLSRATTAYWARRRLAESGP
jgi:group I intron endonuclease